MIIGTANIKNYPDMPKKKVVADAKEVSAICDIWGMQENNPEEDDDAISVALGDEWMKVHGSTDIPIWYRKDKFRLVGARVHLMPFEPVLPLTPRPRNLVAATFKLRGRDVPPFVIMNSHFIAGAYNGDNSKADTARRVSQWDIEWSHLRKFIEQYRRKGYTVFVEGDFNHPRPPKPTPNFAWLVGTRLDRIGVTTTGDVEVEEMSDGVIELNSDHNAQWTRVLLGKRGRI